MIQKLLFLACVGFFVVLAGCSTQKASPAPKTTSDAVHDVVVVAVNQCLRTTEQNSPELKACLYQQMDAAVEQIRRYQKCVSPVGCKPNSGQ